MSKAKYLLPVALLIILIVAIVFINGNKDDVGDSYDVTYKVIEGEDKVELYRENIETKERELFKTLTDAQTRHYHGMELHNGNFYVIRRTESDKDEWIDELWKYNGSKEGEKIYEAQGIDFRVSLNEGYIAIREYDKLLFIDSKGKSLKNYTVDELKNNDKSSCQLGLMKWSDDGKEFWGNIFETTVSDSLYRIKVDSWDIEKYDVSNLDLNNEYQLNPNNEMLVYSDYPLFLDIDAKNEFEGSKTKVNLYLYNLNNKKKIKIATSIEKPFSPEWINNKTIEFNSIEGDGRSIYELKDIK